MNVIVADYKNNSNIRQYTLKGYIDKFVEFLQYNYDKLGSDATITTKEISMSYLDNLYTVVIEHQQKNYGDRPDYLVVHPHAVRLAIFDSANRFTIAGLDKEGRIESVFGVPILESNTIKENEIIAANGKKFTFTNETA